MDVTLANQEWNGIRENPIHSRFARAVYLNRPMPSGEMHYEADNEKNDKDKEQYLCYPCRSGRDAHETEDTSNNRNDEKYDRPI